MKKYRVYVLIFVLLLASGQFCDAVDNTVTIIAEGTYIMGDGETPGAAEQRAFENAKRSAIEQAGVYVESYSQTKNMQLSQDEVNVISSGLVQSTIIDKKRTIEGEGGFRFWCKVSCIIKLDTVESMKARLGDKQSIDQYKDLQAKSAKLEQDLFDLKAQMKNATSDTAKKATEAKIAQNEKQASILDMLARAYQLNVAGDFDSAIVMLTKILTEENNAEAYYYRGWDYSKKGQHDQAITDYSQAIKLKPDFVYAYAARGISYKANGQIDPAIADYSQAIRLKPNDVSTYFNRGNAYADKGQSDQAKIGRAHV